MKYFTAIMLVLLLCIGTTYANEMDYMIYWFVGAADNRDNYTDMPIHSYIFSYNTANGDISYQPLEGYILSGDVPGEDFYLVLTEDYYRTTYYDPFLSPSFVQDKPFDMYHITASGVEHIMDDVLYDDLAFVIAYRNDVLYYYTGNLQIKAVHHDKIIEYDFFNKSSEFIPYIDDSGNIYYCINRDDIDFCHTIISKSLNVGTFSMPALIVQNPEGGITLFELKINESFQSYETIEMISSDTVLIYANSYNDRYAFIEYNLKDNTYIIHNTCDIDVGTFRTTLTIESERIVIYNGIYDMQTMQDYVAVFDMATGDEMIIFETPYEQLMSTSHSMWIRGSSGIGVIRVPD